MATRSRRAMNIQPMKKIILSQITEICEEDLNIMSAEEIIRFYNQLMASKIEDEKNQMMQQMVSQENKKKEIKKQNDSNFLNYGMTQQSKNCHSNENQMLQQKQQFRNENENRILAELSPSQIQIELKQKYYQPRFIKHPEYVNQNAKYRIMSRPEESTASGMRKALITNFTVSKVFMQMNQNQIKQYYKLIRQKEDKQQILPQKKRARKTKIICVCVPKLKITQKQIQNLINSQHETKVEQLNDESSQCSSQHSSQKLKPTSPIFKIISHRQQMLSSSCDELEQQIVPVADNSMDQNMNLPLNQLLQQLQEQGKQLLQQLNEQSSQVILEWINNLKQTVIQIQNIYISNLQSRQVQNQSQNPKNNGNIETKFDTQSKSNCEKSPNIHDYNELDLQIGNKQQNVLH